MKELTDYERQKQKNKNKLVRNEFRVCGKYDMPFIHKQDIDLNKLQFLSFVDAKTGEILPVFFLWLVCFWFLIKIFMGGGWQKFCVFNFSVMVSDGLFS